MTFLVCRSILALLSKWLEKKRIRRNQVVGTHEIGSFNTRKFYASSLDNFNFCLWTGALWQLGNLSRKRTLSLHEWQRNVLDWSRTQCFWWLSLVCKKFHWPVDSTRRRLWYLLPTKVYLTLRFCFFLSLGKRKKTCLFWGKYTYSDWKNPNQKSWKTIGVAKNKTFIYFPFLTVFFGFVCFLPSYFCISNTPFLPKKITFFLKQHFRR